MMKHQTLLEVHKAVIGSRLDRAVLLAGIDRHLVAGLARASSPSAQILMDLQALNGIGKLSDGSMPLRSWLETAYHLTGPRREAGVFALALSELGKNGPSVADPSGPTPGEPGTQEAERARSAASGTLADVVCLTALGLEQDAVTSFLDEVSESELEGGTIVEIGRLRGARQSPRVAVARSGVGNAAAAAAGQQLISHFRPRLVLMVGVAGGIKDVRLGDVVAATKVYGYESGKANDEFLPRPDVGMSSYRLVQRATHEANRTGWLGLLGMAPADPQCPRVFVGPIAAGSAVVASSTAPLYRFLRTSYSDSLAVEMEGRGFLEATYRNRSDALVVRGISDLIDGKSAADQAGSQQIAARNAAAFALFVAERALG